MDVPRGQPRERIIIYPPAQGEGFPSEVPPAGATRHWTSLLMSSHVGCCSIPRQRLRSGLASRCTGTPSLCMCYALCVKHLAWTVSYPAWAPHLEPVLPTGVSQYEDQQDAEEGGQEIEVQEEGFHPEEQQSGPQHVWAPAEPGGRNGSPSRVELREQRMLASFHSTSYAMVLPSHDKLSRYIRPPLIGERLVSRVAGRECTRDW